MSETSNPPPPPHEPLKMRPPPPLVRRLRPGIAIVLVGTLAAVIAAILLIGILDLGTDRRASEPRDNDYRGSEQQVDGGPFGKFPTDYTFTIRPPEPKPLPQPELVKEAPPPAVGPDPEMLKRLEVLRRELLEAMDSPVLFEAARRRGSASGTAGATPHRSAGADPSFDQTAGQPESRQAGNRRFLADAAGVQTYVNAQLEASRSPYELKAGAVIPAALVTAINSDLPGSVIGQVTANVYDSITGQHLVVPQGTRLIGIYNSEVLNGQNRVLVAWQRLIFPNGDSIVLEAMPGVDAAGAAGLHDTVDYHPMRLTGAVLLSTLVAYGGNLAQRQRGVQNDVAIIGETVAQEAGRIGQRIIERELDVPPTLKIRPGWPFYVLVNKDLVLRPHEQGGS